MSIEINQINKSFGRTRVLNDISLDIPSGQMVALLGPSGSGKTTLLRIIAGLEHQNSGHLRFHDKDVTRLHARDRQVGFVFQHYALFRHMTVFDNIAFGLTVLPKRERPSTQAIKQNWAFLSSSFSAFCFSSSNLFSSSALAFSSWAFFSASSFCFWAS